MDENIVLSVKEAVCMEDLIDLYLPGVKKRMGRIPCPIHNGTDCNFAFKGKYYKCYVCGASGDIFTFVESFFAMDFMDALRKIIEDFRLPYDIDGEKNENPEKERLREELERKRRIAKEKREAEKKALDKYHSALDVFIDLSQVIEKYAPIWPDDPIDEKYADACRNFSIAEYNLDQAEIELNRARR